jgi:hypothetical protein
MELKPCSIPPVFHRERPRETGGHPGAGGSHPLPRVPESTGICAGVIRAFSCGFQENSPGEEKRDPVRHQEAAGTTASECCEFPDFPDIAGIVPACINRRLED